MGNILSIEYDNFVMPIDQDNMMINATEMAKQFGKQPKDWLTNKASQEFIKTLSSIKGIPLITDLVEVRPGSPETGGGTWMHKDVGIEFARWLYPKFGIYCNDRIQELFKYGATAINPDNLFDPDFIIKLATELKTSRAEAKLARAEAERIQVIADLQAKELQESVPVIAYANDVLKSTTSILTTVLAKDLGFKSAIALNKKLKAMKIIFSRRGTYMLYSEYAGKGYTVTHTYPYIKKDGTQGTQIQMEWTELGRKFLFEKLSA